MLILVTGTSSGIGRGLAEGLTRAGHTVLGCSRRSGPSLEHYRHFQVDLTVTEQVQRMFHQIRQEYCLLDALINNAGASVMNAFLLASDEEIESIFAINVF